MNKFWLAVPIATVALLTVLPHTAAAQWRATGWTMDIKNDTDACVAMSVADDDAKNVIDHADVWAHTGHHFDDNHTNLTLHAKVWEHSNCTGRFVAEAHDEVHMNRNILTLVKSGSKYVIQREKS